MRIGIIATPLDQQYAGVHYYTKHLIESLLSIDDRNEYFVFREKVDQNSLQGAHQVKIPAIPWLIGYKSLELFYHIPKRARRLDLDVMIEPAHFGPFNLPPRIKRVTVIHDLTPLLFKEWHTFNGWYLQKRFLPGIVNRADLIITNSEYTKQDIITHLGKDSEQIVAALLGISPLFRPVDSPHLLWKYGIHRPYILYQGTIEPRKNLIRLIEAYNRYRDAVHENPRQLVLSGKQGWKYEEIVEVKNRSPYAEDILSIGYVTREDMPAIYSGSDLFIYPSLYEGFGLPIIEALACGAKVITSTSSSLPEVGGDMASYFDPHDTEELAALILTELKIPSTEIDKSQRVQHAREFTWNHTAETVLTALESQFA